MNLLIDFPREENARAAAIAPVGSPNEDSFSSNDWETPAFRTIQVEMEPSDEELLLIRCPLATNPCTTAAPALPQEKADDWFELALKAELPAAKPIVNSWGDEEEDADEELPDDETSEEDDDPDPFEDFDEDDFDDDFDDDFEEELEDEYEIEPKDDGFVMDEDDGVIDPDLIDEEADGLPGGDEEV